MIKYTCPRCKTKIETDDSMSGKEAQCPACQKVNPVPLSGRDIIAKQLQREQERGEAKKEQNKQQEKQTVVSAKKLGGEQSSAIEGASGLLGILCVLFGITGFIVFVVLAQTCKQPHSVTFWFAAMACLVGGFLNAMLFFIAELVLCYLRRIMNAVEADK